MNTSVIRPLFVEFPGLAGQLPHLELADLPTPIERTRITLDESHAVDNLWIKRDDKTGVVYGGNKVRKMEFIVAQALQQGIKKLFTFGGTGTNHGVATALYCRQYGIDCTIFLFDQPHTPAVQANFELMQSLGAVLEHKGSLLRTALHYYSRSLLSGSGTYFLPAGGSNVMGCIAFVNAAFELRDQIRRGDTVEPDTIFCPVGSSGTLAGLTLGCQLAGLKSDVVGVRVAPSHLGVIPICTQKTVRALIKKTYAHLKKMDAGIDHVKLREPTLLNSFYGSGYGSSTPEADRAIASFHAAGLRLETTYTGKAAAAVIRHCCEHRDKQILYWHTFNSCDTSTLVETVESSLAPTGPLENSEQVAKADRG